MDRNIDSEIERHIFMLRHGERADILEKKNKVKTYRNLCDPPLTPLGMIQAEESGRKLVEHLTQLLSETSSEYTIIVECSPFLRCLQTAALAVKQLRSSESIKEALPEQIVVNF